MFSSTKLGSEWVTHEWLSEVLMHRIFDMSDYAGLIAFFAAIIAASFWITYRRSEQRAPNPYIAGLALMIGASATIPTWGVRPQMFSMLFAAAFLWVLDRYLADTNSRLIWSLVPAMILWVNMHAGFPVGLALIVLTMVGLVLDGYLIDKKSAGEIWKRISPLILLTVVGTAAVSVNPNGPRMYSYPLETLRSSSMMQYIQEWRPPDFHDPMFLGLIVLILVTLCVLAVSARRALPSELLLVSATAAATLRSSRNVPFFALVVTPILARHLWTRLAAYTASKDSVLSKQHSFGANKVTAALNILLLVIAPLAASGLRLRNSTVIQPAVESRDFPAAAVEFINSNNLTQPIYNEYHWGGYLIWKLYPRYRVFIDGRADVYGDQVIEEFFKIHDGEREWRSLIDHYGVNSVLVSPNTALASLLREEKDWQKVFEDPDSVIFTRTAVLLAPGTQD
jgi:hypothetical protein